MRTKIEQRRKRPAPVFDEGADKDAGQRGALAAVVIARDAGARIGACLDALTEARVAGLIGDVVVSDGGSSDDTIAISKAKGARTISKAQGRGGQLAAGAAAAQGDWLLFLHADTVLEPGWSVPARRAMRAGEDAAFVFRLAFERDTPAMKIIAASANLRTRLFAAPYGDQGLLIARAAYERIGGFKPMPLFEDVDLIDRFVRAFGRARLRTLRPAARTSAERYERDGPFRRVARNAICLAMYRAGRAPERIADFYAGR